MAGFKKAEPKQAALKMALYGPPGSGKSMTALLVAEGLANLDGRRVAVVDTERGTDWYCQAIPERACHPQPFAFDALYTRSLTEITEAVRALDPARYAVLIIDSLTHVWEATIAAYAGRKNRAGQIPMHAWSQIKKPYKDLIAFLLSSPLHVLLCGRQGMAYQEDEETGDVKAAGTKMRAEGETPYEPHILIRMEAVRPTGKKGQVLTKAPPVPTAFPEKDRSGILSGKVIELPDFAKLAQPLLPYLGAAQATVPTEEETAGRDAEALAQEQAARAQHSADLLQQFDAHFRLAKNRAELEEIAKTITPPLKKQMLPADAAELRNAYLAARRRLDGLPAATPSGNGE